MPRSATTGVYTRVSNSFSQPVFGTLIDPTDADAYFDDLDVGLNPPTLTGPLTVTTGGIVFTNATSGSITVSPPTGALGTVTMTLPDATDTFVGKATTDTLTNKTLTAPAINGATILTSTYNKVTITAPATSATLTLIDGTTLTGPAASGTVMTLGNVETVTGVKTFGSAGAVGKLAIAGTTSGSTVLNATAIASGTLTLPAATDTLVGQATTDTFTGVKTFGAAGNVGKLAVAGTTSGSTILNATAVASGTLTLPAATDTLVGKATTDILTNKTLDSAGTGNVLQVSGVTLSRGNFPGANSNVAATAGNIGEIKNQNILSGSAVALTTTTPANIATITLTAGNWLLWASPAFTGGTTTTVTGLRASLSTTSATEVTTAPNFISQSYGGATLFVTFNVGQAIAPIFVSLSGSQQYWLVVRADFAVSTCSGYGQIAAIRLP